MPMKLTSNFGTIFSPVASSTDLIDLMYLARRKVHRDARAKANDFFAAAYARSPDRAFLILIDLLEQTNSLKELKPIRFFD